MTAAELERQLDSAVWTCLTTRHAHLALGDALTRRYLPAISPIAGVLDAGDDVGDRLAALTAIGDDISIFGTTRLTLGARWDVLRESRITQMIRVGASLLPEGEVDVVTLGRCDVGEMLALVELTQPGPFRERTIELGTYIGIRDAGRLLAMAGERMWIGDFREVSAICTHPDAQGRGYARALIGRVVNRMLGQGQIPFLHVYSTNRRAIELYLDLGFSQRAEFPLLHARRLQ